MVLKFLTRFEDPQNPLLGPTLLGLQYWGLWQKDCTKRFMYNVLHILAAIFIFTQYVELWIIKNDTDLVLRNLSATMLSTVSVFKSGTFVFWQDSWKDLIEYVAETEKNQLLKNDELTTKIIVEYTEYSRKVTFFYWCLVIAADSTFVLTPLFIFLSYPTYPETTMNGTLPHPEIMSSWVPFDCTNGIGFWIYALIHICFCVYGGGVLANFDTTAVAIMTFFAGQLKLLLANCTRLFGDGGKLVNYDEGLENIKESHYHHLYLLKYSSVLNSLLSPVMFLYVIICSLMIGASAIQLTTEGMGNMQRLRVVVYLIAIIAQLFIYCWHSNEVLFMSNQVDDGIYSSAWWSLNVRARRSLLLLGGQLRRPIMFTAGSFTHLNVATFVAILKGSYSYYTLLTTTEN